MQGLGAGEFEVWHAMEEREKVGVASSPVGTVRCRANLVNGVNPCQVQPSRGVGANAGKTCEESSKGEGHVHKNANSYIRVQRFDCGSVFGTFLY